MQARREPTTIFVVDDNETFLAVVGAWIGSDPALRLVGVATSGDEALVTIPLARPDVVLIDAIMPGTDGFETTRRLKRLPDTPRVVMTSFADSDAVRQEAIAAGADEFITKSDLACELPHVLVRQGTTPGRDPELIESPPGRPTRQAY